MDAQGGTLQYGIVISVDDGGARHRPPGDTVAAAAGAETDLLQTIGRAKRHFAPDRLVLVLTHGDRDLPEVRRRHGDLAKGNLLVQPAYKGTAAATLLALLHVYRQHSAALVAVWSGGPWPLCDPPPVVPIDAAFRAVEETPDRIVLLAAEPDGPAGNYGYIVPAGMKSPAGGGALRAVELFVEQPAPAAAEKLIRRGALWNTSIVVASARNLLQVFERTSPELYQALWPIADGIEQAAEDGRLDAAYRDLHPAGLASALYERMPFDRRQNLFVMVTSSRG